MSLTVGQKIWMTGVVALFVVVMGDVLNFYNLPPIHMLLMMAPLLLTSWIMPSMKELKSRNRRNG